MGADLSLVIGLVVVIMAVAGFLYWVVHDTGDSINNSAADNLRVASGLEPRNHPPPLEMQSFNRSLFVGGWLGALGPATYGLIVRQIEVVAYGPLVGFLLGTILFPGVANFFTVHRRTR